jgi:predicted transcriptional regulator YheO
MEEIIEKLYTELYLTIDEIADTLNISKQSIAMYLWKQGLERSGALSVSLRKRLKNLERKERIQYVKKARALKVKYNIISKVLGISHETIAQYVRLSGETGL